MINDIMPYNGDSMKKFIRPIPLVLVYAAIIYLSVKTPSGRPVNIPYMDKIGHFIAYFTLGFTVCLSLSSKVLRIVFIVISLLLGIALEFIQSTLPYRDMSFFDGLSNLLGLFVGVAFFILFFNQVKWLIKKLRLSKIFLEN